MDRDPAGVTGGTALSVVVSKCAADGVADGAGGTAERTAGRAAAAQPGWHLPRRGRRRDPLARVCAPRDRVGTGAWPSGEGGP